MTAWRGASVFVMAAALGACSIGPRDEIEGNNTGGVIPAPMIKGGNAPGLAAAHCAKYGATARVTFEPSQAGGDVVFVCDTPATAGPLPADKGAPGRQPPPPPQKQSPRTG